MQNISTNKQKLDRHITNLKIIVLWSVFIVIAIGIPIGLFYLLETIYH
jgi:hypothetical protein